MPVRWEWRESILMITTIGPYANDELAKAFGEMRSHERFVRGTPLLFDARDSKAELNRADIDWRVGPLANALKRDGFGPLIAFVVTDREPHRFGIARMVQTLTEAKGFEIEVFTDVDAALRWMRSAQLRPNERIEGREG